MRPTIGRCRAARIGTPARAARWMVTVVTAGALLVSAIGCGGESNDAGDPSASTSGAEVMAESVVDARTLDLVIFSPALGTSVGVRLLLPRDWSSQPSRRWPVLYLLHGARATPNGDPPNPEVWTFHTDIEAFTANTNVLVVMPEGGNVGWYSDWYNGGQGGPPGWETFHLTELREILETSYRAGTERAIAGLSMGGFGAASYAARHPGMFRAVASFSGALTTNVPLAQAVVTGSLGLNHFDPNALWGSPVAQADIWAAHDPSSLAEDLVGVPVFVAAGDGSPGAFDPPDGPTDPIEGAALRSAQAFSSHLQELGGDVTTDFYGGGTHTWPYWEQELHRAFPMLMSAIDAS